MVPPLLTAAANEKLRRSATNRLIALGTLAAVHHGRICKLNGRAARLDELLHDARALATMDDRAIDSFGLVAEDQRQLRSVVDLELDCAVPRFGSSSMRSATARSEDFLDDE